MDLKTLYKDLTLDRAFAECDWFATPLGPPETWPESLKTALGIALHSRFPMIVFWGRDLIQLYNEAYRPLIGDKHPAALGQRARDCFPEVWDAIGPMLYGVLDTGQATYSEDLMLPLVRDGKAGEYYFTFSYSPIIDASGVAGVFCAVQETTAAVIHRREAEIRARELTELNRAKSVFLSNISHEFRTPLSLMLAPLAAARDRTSDEESRESIDMATRNALRLQRLVDSLLAFSRIEAGRLEPRFTTVDLASVTGDLVTAFESAAASAGLTLRFEARTTARVPVDCEMWERIVFNLLTNALKYTMAGEIVVRAESDATTFTLSVADSGIGIPRSEREHIFGRFYRLHASGGRSEEGAGIGLALARELVQVHCGTIDVDDRPGGGSVFTVRIPLAVADAVHETPAEPPGHAAAQFLAETAGWLDRSLPVADRSAGASSAHILVVDDNADLRKYLMQLLRTRYRVTIARDGAEALEAIDRDRPDIVLSDVMMPGIDGRELVRRIRERSDGDDIGIVILSARAGAEAVVDGLSGGADDYVSKPFTATELLARIDSQLRLLHARRAAERRTEENTLSFQQIADALPAMVWTSALDGSRDYENAAWLRYTGLFPGESWLAMIHPDDRTLFMEEWQRVTHEGEGPFASDYRLWHAPSGRYRWVTAQATRARIGTQELWIGTTIDIDERKRRELANEFLARASVALNRSFNIEETFRRLAMAVTKDICDYCVFYISEENGFRRMVWKHRERKLQRLLDETIALGPDPSDREWFIGGVLRNAQFSLWKCGDSVPRSRTSQTQYDTALAKLNPGAVLTVPVHIGSTVYGALSLARSAEREPFDDFDVQLITQLADRAAIAFANADLFAREHRVALSFQNAALPDALPRRDGVEIDAHYVAGRSEARVGGDWYDVELLPDGRMLFSVGDVSGSGLDAAVIMSMVRYAIRSVAHVYADPTTILEAAQRATQRRLGEHFITAFVGVLDPVLGRLTYSNAGHVRPLLLTGDTVREIAIEGLPIGVNAEQRWESAIMRVPDDSTIVMYTDGLVEGAGGFLPGDEALHERLRSQEFREHPTARGLYESMLPDGARDDVAILLARISLRDAASVVTTLRLDIETPHDATLARDRICDAVIEGGLLSGEALENARLIIGELTANVARHAPGEALAVIDRWNIYPVFHLVDNGGGFRYSNRLPPVFSENGRGLFIASALARRLEVLPDIDGGSHVIVVFES